MKLTIAESTKRDIANLKEAWAEFKVDARSRLLWLAVAGVVFLFAAPWLMSCETRLQANVNIATPSPSPSPSPTPVDDLICGNPSALKK